MKIMVINPNSDTAMTAAIAKTAEGFFTGKEVEVVCKTTQGAPKFIATKRDQAISAVEMIDIVHSNEDLFDAFVIACHGDPGLDALKDITTKPVVGIGEASMKIASMLGHCFSVISPSERSIPNKEALARKYHLNGLMASVRAPKVRKTERFEEEVFLEMARLAVNEDKAEVIVLGCAGMTGLDKDIQNELGVPVLDGVVCSLIIAEGMVKYGVSTSKIRRYA